MINHNIPDNGSRTNCQGLIEFGFRMRILFFEDIALIESGISLFFPQSPPPNTFPARIVETFCIEGFFMAYFVMSIPSGYLIQRIGYKLSVQAGLVISAMGCYLFYPAAEYHSYAFFLLALFVLASGIAMMQVCKGQTGYIPK